MSVFQEWPLGGDDSERPRASPVLQKSKIHFLPPYLFSRRAPPSSTANLFSCSSASEASSRKPNWAASCRRGGAGGAADGASG